MVTAALRETVDALSVEDQVSLMEYLERIVGVDDAELTDEQLATLDRRDTEMDANPTLGVSKEEFIARLQARWL